MTRPDFVPAFTSGVGHFNALEFWEAHEAWEALWLVAESDVEQFLQGLIQIAAAYHHLRRGTFRGGVRLFDSGLRRLSAFPANFCGIDRQRVEQAAAEHRAWAAERVERDETDARLDAGAYPKITVVGKLVPPLADW